MPTVSKEFVKNAGILAAAVKQGGIGKEASEQVPTSLVETAADTLIEQGLVPANQKQAAVAKLLDHGQCLQALNKTAQMVKTKPLGESTVGKQGSANGETPIRESDRVLFQKLGLA